MPERVNEMAKSNLELKISSDLKEVIREIIREELAAREERLNDKPEIIALSEEKKKLLGDYLKLNPII